MQYDACTHTRTHAHTWHSITFHSWHRQVRATRSAQQQHGARRVDLMTHYPMNERMNEWRWQNRKDGLHRWRPEKDTIKTTKVLLVFPAGPQISLTVWNLASFACIGDAVRRIMREREPGYWIRRIIRAYWNPVPYFRHWTGRSPIQMLCFIV